MLADQLCAVLMTLVEGESFDIIVGSGSGEGLEAWRRLHKRWDPFDDWKSKRIAQRNPSFLLDVPSWSSCKEQWNDWRNGQRHSLAEDIRMAALEALLLEELERHCQLQRSRLDT